MRKLLTLEDGIAEYLKQFGNAIWAKVPVGLKREKIGQSHQMYTSDSYLVGGVGENTSDILASWYVSVAYEPYPADKRRYSPVTVRCVFRDEYVGETEKTFRYSKSKYASAGVQEVVSWLRHKGGYSY